MSKLIRTIILLSALGYAASPARAQETVRARGHVAGRVTDAGKAAAGLQVLLLLNGQTPVAKATTDGEGRYRIANVPPARYGVLPLAPAYVAETESGQAAAGVTVNVGAGEAVEGVDFSLTRGGVITGQVTDAEGEPVVAERVTLFFVDESGRPAPAVRNPAMFETDDRGVYRLFGLPAGRYKVSVGQGSTAVVRAGGRRVVYARTFYPGETDEARAEIIELRSGGEAKGIDIRVGQPVQTFSASGRVVDAQTGRPISGAAFSYAPLSADPRQKTAVGRGLRSGADGEFRIDGLLPGRYVVFSNSEGLGEMYAEPSAFNVTGEDVTGLEVKLRRGVSVSGAFVVEGSNSPGILSRLSQVPVGAFLFQSELNSTGLLS